jgi:hypothetical protein
MIAPRLAVGDAQSPANLVEVDTLYVAEPEKTEPTPFGAGLRTDLSRLQLAESVQQRLLQGFTREEISTLAKQGAQRMSLQQRPIVHMAQRLPH